MTYDEDGSENISDARPARPLAHFSIPWRSYTMPELDSTVHDRCLFAAQVSFNLAVDEYHLVWLPTGEWLYVRLEVGALSVNALWALRAACVWPIPMAPMMYPRGLRITPGASIVFAVVWACVFEARVQAVCSEAHLGFSALVCFHTLELSSSPMESH